MSPRRAAGKARGVLYPAGAAGRGRHERLLPSPELAGLIEHYWLVAWDLRGQPPRRAETLPHPSVHVVFEAGRSEVAGVARARFVRSLKGRGWAVGIKFRPGAFFAVLPEPAHRLTDRVVPVRDLLDIDPGKTERALARAVASGSAWAEVAERFVRALPLRPEPEATATGSLVELARDDRTLLQVEALAERAGLTVRELQRRFRRYVGVSPKWVLRRYRLHEAAERLASGRVASWADLALELGYFDQAHFIRDFKAVVGVTPAAYLRALGR